MNKQCLFVLVLVFQHVMVLAEEPTKEPQITQKAKPIVQVKPIYPLSAVIKGEEGWVQLKMTINEQGEVENLAVVDSQPRKVFDRAAYQAMSQFKFKPRHINGKPVAIEATQTIEFELPNNVVNMKWDNALIDKFREYIDALPRMSTEVILIDSIKIKSTIKPKNVTTAYFFFTDTPNQLNAEPIFWGDKNQLIKQIKGGHKQLEAAEQQVKSQYQKHPNLFKRFHKIYSATSHPPTLLTGVDSQVPVDFKNNTTHKFKLTVDANGQVTDWQSLLSDTDNKASQKWISQLQFQPAIVNHEPKEATIELTFTTMPVNELLLTSEIMLNNKQLSLNIPWVKVAALVDTDGHIEDIKVLDSFNTQFEQIAVMRLKNKRFKSDKEKCQMINVIEFEPTTNQ